MRHAASGTSLTDRAATTPAWSNARVTELSLLQAMKGVVIETDEETVPACAGNTRHPGVKVAPYGTIPRARGAPRGHAGANHVVGTIPACAGSTS
jgi:hypothetical protein